MKHKSIIFLAVAALFLLSCSKADRYRGSYTYKTGGYVVVADENGGTSEISLLPENGQMHVIKDSDSRLTFTMNPIAGSPVVYGASFEGDTVVLAPVDRKIEIGLASIVCTTSAAGTRKDNVIMLNFVYESKAEDITIVESHITCVAVLNE